MNKVVCPTPAAGSVVVPPSKSDAQRAILAAGLAQGESYIRHAGTSEDVLGMLELIQQFGAVVRVIDTETLAILGTPHFPDKAAFLVGESGLGVRLITAVCAAHAGEFSIDGSGSLLHRDMGFFTTYLPQLGVDFKSNKDRLPFFLKGPLQGSVITVDGGQSSQYISGLLMALPLCTAPSELSVYQLKSKPYLRMTIATLTKFGIKIVEKENNAFAIPGRQTYQPTRYMVEGDWSAASYWLVAAALGAKITVGGLSLASLQADKAILSAFLAAGCQISHSDSGISIDGTNKHTFSFDATDCPDLFPALVTFAAGMQGESRITGVHRLAEKESNRGVVLQSEFAKLGVHITLQDDQLVVHGTGQISGGRIQAHNDHRIAMCCAIAALFATDSVTIEQAESVAKSYPEFWNDLARLTP
jgi:3-phosphoshikimate 1-carboxyvinyltransferase